MAKSRAVVKGRSILALDVLGEVRRAQRILRRVEKFLSQQERRVRAYQGGNGAERVQLTPRDRELIELAGQP